MAEESDELRRLQRIVQDLSSKVTLLESRLTALEGRNIPGAALPLGSSAPTLAPTGESRIGLTLIDRIGAFTLAIGIIFFFKYAADNEWIGPTARVFIGLLSAFAFIAAGDWLSKRDQRVFSQGIIGCGLACLYISLYAASEYYKLIPQILGFLLVIGASGFAVGLSFRYRNVFIAALGLGAAFLTILVLRKPSPGGFFEVAYFALIEVVAIFIAIRQQWGVLIPLNCSWAILISAHLMRASSWFTGMMLLLALAHAVASRSTIIQPTKNLAYIAAHACFLLALLRFLSTQLNGGAIASTTDSVLLAVYGLALLALGFLRRAAVDRGIGLVLLGLVIAKLYLYDIWQLQYGFRIVAFVVLGILLLAASYVFSRRRGRPRTEGLTRG